MLRRNHSRKFKSPSFKWRRSKKKKKLENLSSPAAEPVSPSAPTLSPDTSLYTNMEPVGGPVIDLDSNLDLEDTLEQKHLEEKKVARSEGARLRGAWGNRSDYVERIKSNLK